MDAKSITKSEDDLLANDVKGINVISDLLKELKAVLYGVSQNEDSSDEKDSYDSGDDKTESNSKIMELVHALRRSFSLVLERGDLRIKASKNGTDSDALREFTEWITNKYFDFLLLLTKVVDNKNAVYQVAALRTLMHFVQRDGLRTGDQPNHFNAEMYAMVLRKLLCEIAKNGIESIVVRSFINEFIDAYHDVRFYTLICAREMCDRRVRQSEHEKQAGNSTDDSESDSDASEAHEEVVKITSHLLADVDKLSAPVFCEAMCSLLLCIPGDMESAIELKDLWVVSSKFSKKKKVKSFQVRAFQNAWVSYLMIPGMSHETSHKVLVHLTDDILPYLTNPLLLSDFLTDTYDFGGSLAMMSLNSLYVLMRDHGLDYPNFYPKLYQLISIEIFHAKYRGKFFELLDVFLSSTHLASYLVAAFAKKLARLALSASPGAAMFVVVFIANLLKRHPTCLFLVQKPTEHEIQLQKGQTNPHDANEAIRTKLDEIKQASLDIANGVGARRKLGNFEPEEDASKQEKVDSTELLPIDASKRDPFVFEATDPTKCRAMDSCLWEIEALSHHYSPNVSTLVKSLFYVELKKSVETKVINPITPVDELTSISYKWLFDSELKKGRKRQRVPLAFECKHRKTLHDEGIFSLV